MAKKLLPTDRVLYLPELFAMIQKAPDRMTRRLMLVEYAEKDAVHQKLLQQFTEVAFHPAIVWELPEGRPPFASASGHVGQSPSNLFRVFRDISRFLKGGGNFITNSIKRETHFITILESLSTPEAEILITLKDGDISDLYSKVTIDLFCEVFGAAGWLPKDLVDANPPVEDDEDTPKKATRGRPSTK